MNLGVGEPERTPRAVRKPEKSDHHLHERPNAGRAVTFPVNIKASLWDQPEEREDI